jgi:hypothetical protein
MVYKESEKCRLNLYEGTIPAMAWGKLGNLQKTDAGHLVVPSNLEPSTSCYKHRALFLHPSVPSSFIHRHILQVWLISALKIKVKFSVW